MLNIYYLTYYFLIIILTNTIIYRIASFYLLFSVDDGSERLVVFYDITFRQNIVALVIFINYLLTYTFLSANINFECNVHRATLGKQLLKTCNDIVYLRRQLSGKNGFSDKKISILNEMLENSLKTEVTLNSVLETLRVHNNFKPLKVLGVMALYSLPVTIFSASSTFFLTLMSIFATTLQKVSEENA
jgi:hypothetical protein